MRHDYAERLEARRERYSYAAKAESVGTAGISQDDPEAITKLKAKLAKLEEHREKK